MSILSEDILSRKLKGVRVGFAMCGSFCTFSEVFPVIEQLVAYECDVFPIMSHMSYSTDTRYGTAEYHRNRFQEITGKKIIHEITTAEEIGPKKMFDVLVVAPCTSNTLAKIANGVNDTPVTMAIKSHIRNLRPVVLAIATNDALSGSAHNVGKLINRKYIYFTPMHQDNYITKPNSVLAFFEQIPETIYYALDEQQIQPVTVIEKDN